VDFSVTSYCLSDQPAGHRPGAQVKSLVRSIESSMKRESEAVYRVDIVPIDRAQAVT
jgi:hypothetical protein